MEAGSFPVTIRASQDEDVEAMLAIYRHHIGRGVDLSLVHESEPLQPHDLKRRRRNMRNYRLPRLVSLIDNCAAAGYRQMIGYIDAANKPSIQLHQSCGFRQVGYLCSVGYKFGNWTDVLMVQRSLGSGGTTPPDIWLTVPIGNDSQ